MNVLDSLLAVSDPILWLSTTAAVYLMLDRRLRRVEVLLAETNVSLKQLNSFNAKNKGNQK